MTDVHELDDLLYLIRCGINRTGPESARVQGMNLERLYALSRYHSLAALTYTALESARDGRPPREAIPAGWKEARDTAIRNALLFAAERKALETFCEENGIWYLPLKGILLQNDYPGLGLREMADHDILFDADFQQQIHDWFVARGYTVDAYRVGVHDSYHKPPVLNFEMHTALFSAETSPAWDAFFTRAVARLLPQAGTRWGRRFSPEDFYLYILTHMYKHFAGGGTGLRSLLDIYVFFRAHGKELDETVLQHGLEQLGLVDFDRETRTLADRVFGHGEALDPQTAEKLAYYVSSGTYGTQSHHLQNDLHKLTGEEGRVTLWTKLRYLWQRLFPPKGFLQSWCNREAPVFLRHRWLMPLAPWYRMLHTLFGDKAKKMRRELRSLWKQ